MLWDFSFPQVVINLMKNCIISSSLSLLWNGNQLESFTPTRGLHQGDPLSFYLFVVCMEKLALLISEKVNEGYWRLVVGTKKLISALSLGQNLAESGFDSAPSTS